LAYKKYLCLLIGIGKTTLANQICLNWAEKIDFLSKDYDLVILIKLRRIQEKTLEQEMIDVIGSKSDYDELLTQSDGNMCLIILEGLDEVSKHWQENDKMFTRLIKSSSFLSYANILITSKPHAWIYLYEDTKKFSRTIEIVGFDKPQMQKYAERHFKDANKAEKFMEQVNNNPHIRSLCYVPLCLKMVLQNFEGNDETLKTTLTGQYQSFIISEVIKGINRKNLLLSHLEQYQRVMKNALKVLLYY